MQFPCEILVKNILPAIRAIMVKELNEKYGKSQKEIANLLGITQPSVSYYLHGERGGKAINIIKDSTKETYQTILGLAEKLVTGNLTTEKLLKQICTICMEVRPVYIQEVCPDKFDFLKDWNVCFME
ncbi:MAG: helix-turn-helix domain-containing protein [Candidatus Helarchaeota archaeon]|nr:helix-turn-helix domain-containing protein [Candidatus Helarchaeota archaeon]